MNCAEDEHQCQQCDRLFKNLGDLKRHILIHTGEKLFQCSVCLRRFRIKSSLTRHSHLHSGIKPLKCNLCEKSFVHRQALTIHVRSHTGEKPYQCPHCEKAFKEQRTLNYYICTVHESRRRCDICKKEFVWCNVRRHMKLTHGIDSFDIRSDVPVYQCSLCRKSFRSPNRLVVHGRRHTGEKPHNCLKCDKTFRRMRRLKRHLFTHYMR